MWRQSSSAAETLKQHWRSLRKMGEIVQMSEMATNTIVREAKASRCHPKAAKRTIRERAKKQRQEETARAQENDEARRSLRNEREAVAAVDDRWPNMNSQSDVQQTGMELNGVAIDEDGWPEVHIDREDWQQEETIIESSVTAELEDDCVRDEQDMTIKLEAKLRAMSMDEAIQVVSDLPDRVRPTARRVASDRLREATGGDSVETLTSAMSSTAVVRLIGHEDELYQAAKDRQEMLIKKGMLELLQKGKVPGVALFNKGDNVQVCTCIKEFRWDRGTIVRVLKNQNVTPAKFAYDVLTATAESRILEWRIRIDDHDSDDSDD